MRILVAHSFYKTFGGEDRYVGQYMKLLSDVHDVALLERTNADLPGNIRTAARMIFSRREGASVDKELAEFAPDVVHLHNPYPGFGPAVHLAVNRRDVPLVMTIHNFRLRCPNSLMFTEGELCRRCERGVYAHAWFHDCFPTKAQALGYSVGLWTHRFVLDLEDKVDVFVVPSRFMQGQLEKWGIARDRVALVRNFTDVPTGNPSPGEFGLYFGRLSPEKGIEHLIAALRIAGDPPFRIVGDGLLRDEVARRISQAGLRNTTLEARIPAEEVPGLLHNARYVVLPSVSHENAPLAALEAMAAARPLVVTERGGLPELVEDGAGLTCRAGDAEDLARAIQTLMDDVALCQRAGEKGAQRAREDFGPRTHLRRLEEVYASAIGDTSRRRTRPADDPGPPVP